MLAALILVGGSLGDRLGRKRVFMLGIGLFMLASLACGLAPNIQWMITSRIIQGIGGALMIPGSLAIIAAFFDSDQRGKAIGTWATAASIVTVAGPLLGGVLADAGFWRGVFLINLPLGILALLVLYFRVPESRDEVAAKQIDILGATLNVIGLAGFTYGFISAPELGFANPQVYGALAIGVVALVVFVVFEARSQHPLLPLQLFRSHTFSGSNLLTLFLYGALNVGIFFLSLNMVQAQGYSKTLAGSAFLPFSFLLIGLSRWAGGLADRRGPRLLLIAGPTLAGFGFLLMAFPGLTQGASDYWKSFFPGIVTFGLGMGLTVAPLSTAVMGSVETHYSGTASGINNAVSRTAGALAIAIVGSIALFLFTGALRDRTASLNITEKARAALQAEAGELGGAAVPAEVGSENMAAAATAIKLAFVDVFRWVMIICAGLAWISAGMAAFLVEPRLIEKRE
jgi:EmrB/QacA subfamily drug resistance transporter